MNDPGPIGNLRLRVELAEHMNIVRSYTHAILNARKEIGTGVAFRVGDRLFLITAGHVLRGTIDVWLFSGEGPAIRAEVLNHHAHPDSLRTDVYSDVGFVEIRNVSGARACDFEQLHVGEAVPKLPTGDKLVFIAGCPVSGYTGSTIGTAIIAGFLRGGDATILEVEYERSGHSVTPDGSSFQEADFFETPEGFSGAGVWVLHEQQPGELFAPHRHVKMCGTQFQWDPKTRMLKAMRPRVSVPFFYECYPELRPTS